MKIKINAVLLYFLLKEHLKIETISWICTIGVILFDVLGFVKYNGMIYWSMERQNIRSRKKG